MITIFSVFSFCALLVESAERMHDAPADEEVARLIEAAQNGDGDAFAALAERYQTFVHHTACRVLSSHGRDTALADDITEDALVKAWRSLGSFRGDSAFSTWLYRITVNAARDYLRQESRHKTVSLTRPDEDDDGSEWDLPVTSSDEIPEEAADRRETILAVRRAVESLPEDQRRVVVLRDLDELPYQDIAELLGLSLGTVKSRLNRGRLALKKILEDGNYL